MQYVVNSGSSLFVGAFKSEIQVNKFIIVQVIKSIPQSLLQIIPKI